MKKILLLFALPLTIQQSALAQCNVGNYTVTGNQTITGSCIITGNLTIPNGATLDVDLTAATADTFVVQGNILLQGNGYLWVHSTVGSTNDQFIVSNNFNQQRTITAQDSSEIRLENIEFRTQEGNLTGASSISMNYNAEDSSIFYVSNTWLNNQTAWLLLNLKNKATYIGYEPSRVPTEMYMEDSVQVELHGANTRTGVWMNFQSITDTLNLPPNQTLPLSWAIGRSMGGLNAPWYLELDSVQQQEVGLGAQILPSSNVIINGSGLPATGEIKVALLMANGTDTLQNLQVGLQNTTIANDINGSVTMNNVNLGPIAWQIYALMNENLFIKNSVINEIGIGGPSSITVDSCLLQLAVLSAQGIGGSTMTINNTELWNQEITAFNNSDIVLNNCNVYGSMFSTSDGVSSITVNGGCFFQNPAGCTQANMVNIATGQPNCNPFIPPGFPQNLTPSTVTFNGVNYNCTTGINETPITNSFQTFPNPATSTLNISFSDNQKTQIQIFNAMGILLNEILANQSTQIDISDLPSGLYFVHLKSQTSQTQKFIKQ
jgi:hypothetical protein